MPLIYDGSNLTKGDIYWSKYCEISSVGQLQAETISLPGLFIHRLTD